MRTDRNHVRDRARKMAEDLSALVADSPRDRAALRRTLGRDPADPRVRPAHGIVTRYLPDPDSPETGSPRGPAPSEAESLAVEWAFYTVAALIAAQTRDARDQAGRTEDEQDGESRDEEDRDEAARDEGGEAGRGAVGAIDRPIDRTAETAEAAPGAGPTGEDGQGQQESGPEPGSGRRRVRPPNLGAALAAAVQARVVNEDTAEKRLHLLCRQSLAGVHNRLPQLVRHLRSGRVGVDWSVLTLDLARWATERDHVAKEWLQGYHRAREQARARERKRRPDTPTNDNESE